MTPRQNEQQISGQYRDGKPLSTRISLHDTYSTNPYGFRNWVWNQYDLPAGSSVLELGCGTAIFWKSRIGRLLPGTHLVLSDASEGMVQAAKDAVSGRSAEVQRIDIRAIPFPENTFDRVIANHMLYHLPDPDPALSEVARILKPDGFFYATTNGTGGLQAALHALLREFCSGFSAFGADWMSFTLENGADQLRHHFGQVTCRTYEDALHITQAADLAAYIRSSASLFGLTSSDLEGLDDFLDDRFARMGALHIPKDVGIFIASEPERSSV